MYGTNSIMINPVLVLLATAMTATVYDEDDDNHAMRMDDSHDTTAL